MKRLMVLAMLLISTAAHADSQERKPANRLDLASALSSALIENDRLRDQRSDVSAEPSDDSEKPKIFVELGDGK